MPASDSASSTRGSDATTRPTKPSSRIELFRRREARVDPGQPDRFRARRAQSGDQLRVDGAREDLQHGVDRLVGGDAQARDEAALNAALFEKPGHLLAAAMHHSDRHSDAATSAI